MYQWIPETEAKTKAQKTYQRLSQLKEISFLILLCCLITSSCLQNTVFSSRPSTNMCSIWSWEVQVTKLEKSVHLFLSKESQFFSSSCLALFITRSCRLIPAISFSIPDAVIEGLWAVSSSLHAEWLSVLPGEGWKRPFILKRSAWNDGIPLHS